MARTYKSEELQTIHSSLSSTIKHASIMFTWAADDVGWVYYVVEGYGSHRVERRRRGLPPVVPASGLFTWLWSSRKCVYAGRPKLRQHCEMEFLQHCLLEGDHPMLHSQKILCERPLTHRIKVVAIQNQATNVQD